LEDESASWPKRSARVFRGLEVFAATLAKTAALYRRDSKAHRERLVLDVGTAGPAGTDPPRKFAIFCTWMATDELDVVSGLEKKVAPRTLGTKSSRRASFQCAGELDDGPVSCTNHKLWHEMLPTRRLLGEIKLYGELHRLSCPCWAAGAAGFAVGEGSSSPTGPRKFGRFQIWACGDLLTGFLDLLTVKFLTGVRPTPPSICWESSD